MTQPEYDIVIQESDFQQLRKHLLRDSQVENAAYLLCGRSSHRLRVKLLVKDVLGLSGKDFNVQSGDRLQISPEAVARVMKRARLNDQCIVLAHSHPFCDKQVDFSWVDDKGDLESFSNFYQRVPTGPHASLVFGQTSVRGRVWLPDLEVRPLTSITVVGSILKRFPSDGRTCENRVTHQDNHDRQVLAFGTVGQTRIAEAAVAVVGVGGTGSVVVDQMIRLGVRDLVVIDDDLVEASNTSRIYNSTFQDATAHTPKVNVVERHARSVGFGTNLHAIRGNITEEITALELRRADVIFCCTDNHWSRAILNQYSYQYLTPVIDMGNKIDSKNGRITGANGRVYMIAPKRPCLWCYGILDGKRIAEETLPADQRESLAREGYVTNGNSAAPSVIFLNTVIAGLAVAEFVNFVTGYMGRGYHPQLTYYPLTGEVKSIVYGSGPSCDCNTNKHTALGDNFRLPCR
jgi:hypothetical protein